jgi:Leucine-rich repeat (LRR) protein
VYPVDNVFPLYSFLNTTGLSVRGNNLHNFKGITEGGDTSQLKYLDFSDNEMLGHSHACVWGDFPQLTALDVSKNKLSSLTFGFPQLPALTYLDIHGNRIVDLRHDLPYTGYWFPYPNLQYLNLDAQQGDVLFVDAEIFLHPTLVELHLNTKRDRTINYDDYRKFREVSEDNTVLQHLYADGSDLEAVDENTFLDIFGHLKALRTLSLCYSQLDFVTTAMFANFVNLTTLKLRGNIISVLTHGIFDAFTQLRNLDLYGNKITVVSQETFISVRSCENSSLS